MRRIVLFTVGFHARAACRHLLARGDCRVVGFVDNDPAVQGQVRLGLPVWAPGELARLEYDVIAVPGRNQDAIVRQLTDRLGVPRARIWVVRKSEVPVAPAELAARGGDLAGLLGRTVEILRRVGARHWVLHSSLLALERGQDLAVFSDVDLGVDAGAFDLLREHFASGFNAQFVPHPAGAMADVTGPVSALGAINLSTTPTNPMVEPAMVDLHSISFDGARACWWVDERTLQVPVRHFAGQGTRSYRGLDLAVPVDAAGLLERLYGADWRTPAESWNGRYAAPVLPALPEPALSP